ncbi:MAG: PHP domain-containing protein [Desulfobacterales bacterium]|nr:PHP domain-containing protein [Desulfobacterales bacterium]
MDRTNRVQFEKPDISELVQHYTVVDLHFHTRYSDGLNTVRQIAKQVRQQGIGISITDHNDIRGAVEIDEYKDILSIPGIEVTSQEGSHLLIYFYGIASLKHFFKEHIHPNMGNGLMSSIALPMEAIIEKARAFKTVVILPHPYCTAYTGVCNPQFSIAKQKRLFDLVDGVEAINSENLKKWNLKCAVLGFNLNKTVVGGSDGHALYQIGKVVSYANCKRTREAFLDAVREKQNKVIGKEIDIFRKVTSNGLKLRTNIRNCPDLIEKNIRYSCTVLNSKSKKLRDNIKRRLNGNT